MVAAAKDWTTLNGIMFRFKKHRDTELYDAHHVLNRTHSGEITDDDLVLGLQEFLSHRSIPVQSRLTFEQNKLPNLFPFTKSWGVVDRMYMMISF